MHIYYDDKLISMYRIVLHVRSFEAIIFEKIKIHMYVIEGRRRESEREREKFNITFRV